MASSQRNPRNVKGKRRHRANVTRRRKVRGLSLLIYSSILISISLLILHTDSQTPTMLEPLSTLAHKRGSQVEPEGRLNGTSELGTYHQGRELLNDDSNRWGNTRLPSTSAPRGLGWCDTPRHCSPQNGYCKRGEVAASYRLLRSRLPPPGRGRTADDVLSSPFHTMERLRLRP